MNKEEALRIFSLSGDYTTETLLRAYHKKLFDIHPDTSSRAVSDAGILIDEIVRARMYLEEILKLGLERKRDKKIQEGGDDGYAVYREASAVLGEALEQYWKERLRWSQCPPDSPILENFRERMRHAKNLFADVLNRYPGGMWTPDSVEQIARINLWLSGKNGPLRG